MKNIIFVLVRPEFLGNIGSVARVMKNFGFTRLRLVEPPKNYKDAEARKMAVNAFDILKSSQVYGSLAEALKDVQIAIATTSGQQRDVPLTRLSDAMEIVGRSHDTDQIAIVFGSERDGLNKDEIVRCHHATTIPTNPEFPALNIAQAVGLMAYELIRSNESSKAEGTHAARPSGAKDDELFSLLTTLLDQAQFTRTFNQDLVLSQLRSFYQRAQPTERETDLLKGALQKLSNQLKRIKSD